jgi:hypothetical protein
MLNNNNKKKALIPLLRVWTRKQEYKTKEQEEN